MCFLNRYCILFIVMIAVSTLTVSLPAVAQQQVNITPSQAATIAKEIIPGSTVVGVKLQDNGTYAVTLRAGGKVERITVDAENGSVR